jgi:hypothetical protein
MNNKSAIKNLSQNIIANVNIVPIYKDNVCQYTHWKILFDVACVNINCISVGLLEIGRK